MKPAPSSPGANCGLCGRQVVLGFWFRAHMDSAHLDTLASYNCKICGNGNFLAKEDFLAHVEEAHQSALTGGDGNSTSNGDKEKEPRKSAASRASEHPDAASPSKQEVAIWHVASESSISEVQDHSRVLHEDEASKDEASNARNRFRECENVKAEVSKEGLSFNASEQEKQMHPEAVDHVAKKNDTKSAICGKFFTQRGSLQQHIQAVHRAIKRHVCKDCGRAFSQGHSLKRHAAKMHGRLGAAKGHPRKGKEAIVRKKVSVNKKSKKKEVTCDMCGKGFSGKGALKIHVNVIHLGKSKYCCRFCGKPFAGPYLLREHTNAHHLGMKPHKCEDCGRAFGFKSSLSNHVKTAHHHDCNLCPAKFAQKEDMLKHVKEAHVEIKNEA